MQRIPLNILTIVLILLNGGVSLMYPQENPNPDSKLTLPWTAFKQLLNLDDDEIVLHINTFQKLVAQTGIKAPPSHTIKAGKVVLTRSEFQKLINAMKAPESAAANPPFPYLLTKALYSGKMQHHTTVFKARFDIQVLKKDTYLKIPLLRQHIALQDIKVNDKPALVVNENGYHHIILSQAGSYIVTALFSLKSSLDNGPRKLDLPIPQTPITLLELEMPVKEIDVEIPQAQQLLSHSKDNATLISAVISSSGRTISIHWRKKATIAEKLPPKLYSELYHLISIEDDALKMNSTIKYNILHSEIDRVSLTLPEGMNILSVSGQGVGEWQETLQTGQRQIRIPFTYSRKGVVTVRIITEIPLSETGLNTFFSGIQTLETVREIGFIGVELNTSAEIIIKENEGLEKIAVQKLPRSLINTSAKPLLRGFKYLKHPYRLALDIKKHQKIAVPAATINSANVVTLFTEDGKVVHRLIYQIKNSAKQFLEISLPSKADVWSVFVDNQPVESSVNSEGNLLVPLIRSRSEQNHLTTFPVEVIYALTIDRFTGFGTRTSVLPPVDLLISQLIWSVYLPNDYGYLHFQSTLEKEELIRGLNILSYAPRQYNEKAMQAASQPADRKSLKSPKNKFKKAYKESKHYQSRFRNVPVEEELSDQVMAELQFGNRLDDLTRQQKPSSTSGTTSSGVLPIHIQVPTSGQLYRFAKTLIQPAEPLMFQVTYIQAWVIGMTRWGIFFLILFGLFLIRETLLRFWKKAGKSREVLQKWYQGNKTHLKKYIQSPMAPFVWFGLIIVCWPLSLFLTLCCFLGFWISTIYHILNYFRKRAQRKSIPLSPTEAPETIELRPGDASETNRGDTTKDQ